MFIKYFLSDTICHLVCTCYKLTYQSNSLQFWYVVYVLKLFLYQIITQLTIKKQFRNVTYIDSKKCIESYNIEYLRYWKFQCGSY